MGVGRICFCWIVTGVQQITLELWRWYSQGQRCKAMKLPRVGPWSILHPGGLEKCRAQILALPPITPHPYSDPILLGIATPPMPEPPTLWETLLAQENPPGPKTLTSTAYSSRSLSVRSLPQVPGHPDCHFFLPSLRLA